MSKEKNRLDFCGNRVIFFSWRKKQTFVYSSRKRSPIVPRTSICIEQSSCEEWRAYKAIGVYPAMDFSPYEGNGKTPASAIKSLSREEKKWKKECI